MIQPASLFPLSRKPSQTYIQTLARGNFRVFTDIAQELGVNPKKVDVTANQDGTLNADIRLPADGFDLILKLNRWDDATYGPYLEFALAFGYDAVGIVWDAEKNWEGFLRTAGSTNTARVIALATNLVIKAQPKKRQPLMKQEVQAIAERAIRYYLDSIFARS